MSLGSKILANLSLQDSAMNALATNPVFIQGILSRRRWSWTFSLRGRRRFLKLSQYLFPSLFDIFPVELEAQMIDLEIVRNTRPWRI